MNDSIRPSVFVITVTCNDAQNLKSFIPSLMASDYDNFSLVIVDNASNEVQQKLLDIEDANIKVLHLADNIGYAGACNAGIAYALENNADYVFLLNNDTRIAVDAISELVNVAEKDTGVAIVGPLLLHMNHPDMIQEYGGEINVCRAEVTKYFENQKFVDTIPKQKQVTFIGGGISLIRADILKEIGFLDENYFLYYDEVDFDTRVSAYGYRLVVTSMAKVWHDTGYVRLTKLRTFFAVRNRFYFVKNNNSLFRYIRFNLYFAFCVFPRTFATIIAKGNYGVSMVFLLAWYNGVLNCMDLRKAKKILKLH